MTLRPPARPASSRRPARPGRRRAVLALAALAVATACAPDDVPDVAVGPTRVDQLTLQPRAAAAVAEGLAALRRADAGTFELRLTRGGRSTEYEGSYRLASREQRWSVVAGTGRRAVLTEGVGRGDDVWVRLPQRGNISTRCWLAGPAARVARVTGLDVDPRSAGLSALVALLDSARGVEWARQRRTVHGTVDLAAALALASPRLQERLAVPAGDARVVAAFTLEGGVLAGVRVEAIALVAALERVRPDVPRLRRAFTGAPPVDLVLADPGARIVILAPPPGEVVDLAAPDARSRLAGC